MTPPSPSTDPADWRTTPLRDLGLSLGDSLCEVIDQLRRELEQRGITRVRPRFYLSTEWGVPFGTVAVAIPFYLARVDLTRFHADRAGYVEGADRDDILRYLRHEVGHVINYAYRLYQEPEWARLFGDINQDYEEEYRPRPFSHDYVRHLPGWYAQKHPDEDWAETFAVWLTPGLDWRRRYAGWPVALAKLEYCDRTLAALRDRDPPVTDDQLDEDVGELVCTVEDFYGGQELAATEYPIDADDALDSIVGTAGGDGARAPLAELLRRLEADVSWQVYRWTGHFPERTRDFLRRLATRAAERGLTYAEGEAPRLAVSLTALVTALALSHDAGAPASPLPP